MSWHAVPWRGAQGVVFRGTLNGIEAAIKVISHREDSLLAAKAAAAAAAAGQQQQQPSAPAGAGGTPASAPIAIPSEAGAAAAAAAAAAASAAAVEEGQLLRERKRNMLRDALELAVTSSLSHPSIVQVGSGVG